MKISTIRSIIIFLIIVFVDIPLRGYDMLPDVVGYFGLFVCFTIMIEHDKRFVRAQNFALLLFLLNIVFVFNLVTDEVFVLILTFSGHFMNLMMVYYMFTSFSSMSVVFDHRNLVPYIDIALFFYFPTTAMIVLSPLIPALSTLFTFINYIIYGIVLIVLLHCYNAFHTSLSDFTNNPESVPKLSDPLDASSDSPL